MLPTVIIVLAAAAALEAAATACSRPPADRAPSQAEGRVPIPDGADAVRSAAIRTIDPDDEDFSDLMPLKEFIGSARVVALGEQSHGDGACFAAKHRLIRFLHQEMGFDVLAWESGMFDCRVVNEALAGGESVEDAWRLGIFPIFGESAQVRVTLEYVQATKRGPSPLEIAGFDCQFSGTAGIERFADWVQDFFDAADRSILREAHPDAMDGVHAIIASVMRGEPGTLDDADANAARDGIVRLLEAFETHSAALAATHNPREIAFARQVIENVVHFDRSNRQGRTNTPKDTNIRDIRMGENIAWLADEYFAGRKIIVWAASFHLMRNAGEIKPLTPELSYEGTIPMGHVAHELLGDDWYAVMFTAYKGEAGNPFFGSRDLDEAPEGSLEAILHDRGEPFAFIDLRTLPDDDPFAQEIVARPLGYAPMRARWGDHFDAAFHTDVMFPSTATVALPERWRTAREPEPDPDDPRLAVRELMDETRRTVIAFDLEFRSVVRPDYHEPDFAEVDMFDEDQWPRVLGHVHPDPDGLALVAGDEPPGAMLRRAGRIAFTTPYSARATLNNYSTVLFLEGVDSEGRLRLDSYGTFASRGDMAGGLDFRSYATAYINGDLTGRLDSYSYFAMVVTGDVTGALNLHSAAMVYVLGSVEGDVTLAGGKFAIAGRMTREQIEQHIRGRGRVFLQSSDMEDGEHTVGELTVRVGVRVAP